MIYPYLIYIYILHKIKDIIHICIQYTFNPYGLNIIFGFLNLSYSYMCAFVYILFLTFHSKKKKKNAGVDKNKATFLISTNITNF